jgi:hypothetical protein
LRQINRILDSDELREHLTPFYSHTGRPWIDPELMLRTLAIGYCYGIRSKRRLCEEVSLNLAYRWFCRLSIEDKVPSIYKRHRFPPEIISYAVWLYHRFNLSHRDIEDMLSERGITVSYEAIRLWCTKFDPKYAGRLKRKHQGYGNTLYIDEIFVKIRGKQHYLWRAVDQDGEVVDVYLQARRDGTAAKRFFNRLLRSYVCDSRRQLTLGF